MRLDLRFYYFLLFFVTLVQPDNLYAWTLWIVVQIAVLPTADAIPICIILSRLLLTWESTLFPQCFVVLLLLNNLFYTSCTINSVSLLILASRVFLGSFVEDWLLLPSCFALLALLGWAIYFCWPKMIGEPDIQKVFAHVVMVFEILLIFAGYEPSPCVLLLGVSLFDTKKINLMIGDSNATASMFHVLSVLYSLIFVFSKFVPFQLFLYCEIVAVACFSISAWVKEQ